MLDDHHRQLRNNCLWVMFMAYLLGFALGVVLMR
jgi:hypothetical protein